ncbi:hypothetical protein HAX54_042832 [Datura stramonium]|uniref:Uncharacterized protein n=1 Tax=Datura stramonium TaxID=4076 RepID=A0ABS8W2D1_DATST|nr:hypothetical protein [Datura stramonium]
MCSLEEGQKNWLQSTASNKNQKTSEHFKSNFSVAYQSLQSYFQLQKDKSPLPNICGFTGILKGKFRRARHVSHLANLQISESPKCIYTYIHHEKATTLEHP